MCNLIRHCVSILAGLVAAAESGASRTHDRVGLPAEILQGQSQSAFSVTTGSCRSEELAIGTNRRNQPARRGRLSEKYNLVKQ